MSNLFGPSQDYEYGNRYSNENIAMGRHKESVSKQFSSENVKCICSKIAIRKSLILFLFLRILYSFASVVKKSPMCCGHLK